jgi:anthranilate phosphoribosyltransferase
MHQLITKIGKGQRGAKDLSWGEAKQAAQDLIEGNATPYQAGAFLMAMRIKLEGVTELASFTAATRSYVPPISVPADLNVVDVPVYAEKHNTQHGCLPAAIVAAAAGATILFHGMDNPTASSDLPRILGQLGVPTTLQGQDLLASLQRNGFAYLDIALYHPPLAKLLALREQLGAQNLFHQVARLLNPTRAHSQVMGVAHPPYLEKMPEAVNMLGGHRLMVFQGMEGFPELSIAIPTIMRELRNNRVTPFTLKPPDVQLPLGSFQHMAIPSQFLRQDSEQASPKELPVQEAALIRQVLHTQIFPGSGQARFRDWILYNAAMLLYAAGQAHSIAEGVPLAQKALESGAAAKKLAALASPPASLQGSGQASTTPEQKVVHV